MAENNKQFVHLHTHSHYSLLDGLAKLDQLIKKAASCGMPALALTDHGNMYGAIEFYKACKKAGIKPIIGVEAYVAFEDLEQKRAGIDNKIYHLVLLAKNETGYKNIIKLVTISHLQGFYYRPRVDKKNLREHSEGVIALSACMAGELSRLIKNQDIDGAEKAAREYEDIFGKGNFYIEIGYHPNVEGHAAIQKELIKISQKTGIPLVATQDIHYLNSDDAEAQDVLVAVQTNAQMSDTNRMSSRGEDYSMRTPEEMWDLMRDTPEALENTAKIAEQCNLTIEIGKFVFPVFPIPQGETADSVLKKLALDGLERRGLNQDQASKDRLEYELDIISFKGYASYFLVVADLIRCAQEKEIYYNIRGSVAGSMTTYALGITKVNPLEYKIPFERFLNPERPSAPDIDMDFADDRRNEIIEYAIQKYGADKVAQIGTFGTMAARAAVKDVTRALGKPYSLGDQISKLIPPGSQGFPMTIDTALEITPELKDLYINNQEVTQIIDLAKKMEGCNRHISVHAAGVVIAPEPLVNYVPLQYDPKEKAIITQYDMYSVGEDGIGLTKFDFLGLKNLSILEKSVLLVRKIHNIKIDLETIPLDDKKTFELLVRGDTIGLFQLNGAGMTKWLKELRPTTIHDINAMVALYRPGPMQFIPEYIAHKHNSALTKYLDPALKPILEESYGVLVYQDQLLMMAHDLAGYSWGEVDKFRKAVGKKIPELMAQQRDKFVKGCIEHSGWSEKKAAEVWRWLEPFAAYGFNKAHSASYGRVAYQTAYMKANYPAEFMTAVLSADAGDNEKIAESIAECKRMDLPVLPPDINESFGDFTVINLQSEADSALKQGIRFGLYTIKNLGEEISNVIIEERKNNGNFTSFSNFLERIRHRNMNKKSLDALIRSGALDAFEDRNVMLQNMEEALAYNKNAAGDASQNQASLFNLMENKQSLPGLKLKEAIPASAEEKLNWERELLGLYISGHPLDKFKEKLAKLKHSVGDTKKLPNEISVVIGGMIEEVRKIMTKKNEPMAFIKISDYENTIEAVVFPRVLKMYESIIREGACVGIKGKSSVRNGETSIIIDEMKEMTA